MCLSAVSGPSLRFVCILCYVPEASGGALVSSPRLTAQRRAQATKAGRWVRVLKRVLRVALSGFCMLCDALLKMLSKIHSIFVHFEENPVESEKILIASSEPLLEWVYLLQANLQHDILNLYKTPKFEATHFVPSLPELAKLGPEFWLKGIEIPPAILKNEEEQLPPE